MSKQTPAHVKDVLLEHTARDIKKVGACEVDDCMAEL